MVKLLLCLFAAVIDTASSSVGRGDLWHDYCRSVVSDAAGELQLFICGPHSSLFTRGSLCAFRICSAPPANTVEITDMFLSVPRLAGFLTDQNKASGIVVHLPYVCVIDQEGWISAQVFCRSQACTCWPPKLDGKHTTGRCQRPGRLLRVLFAPDVCVVQWWKNTEQAASWRRSVVV